MKRIPTQRRPDWERKVKGLGLFYYQGPEGLYWDEGAYYEFTASEVDTLERATNELQGLCLDAVQHVIDRNRFAELCIPEQVVPLIRRAWEEEPPSIYGRFDLAYDGVSEPKLLEYNADTPTSLLESSVVQWYWLEERFKGADQFNSIHERLLAKWAQLRFYIRSSPLYFTFARGFLEDEITIDYLRDTAEQSGIPTVKIPIQDIGWHHDFQYFVDLDGNRIGSIFKLYPWEWLVQEEFGPWLISTHPQMQWIEPIWKLVLSNKGILPILWELYPDHPNLLRAHFGAPRGMPQFVRKPLFSREGANIRVRDTGKTMHETGGTYGAEGYIYQQTGPVKAFDGNYPVLGSWVVDGESAGVGIRESLTPVTDNVSRFIPHLFA